MKWINYIMTSLLAAILVTLWGNVFAANAHGTNIAYTVQSTVEIVASFDTGEPMSEAQITIYAPSDPETPWENGVADENGRYIFTPDPEILGTWDVSIRTAGHGEILNIPLEENGVTVVSGNATGPLQNIIVGLAVIWGFVGTALYFSARNNTTQPQAG